VSVDYGLAPEKQFPHGLMDCVAVYQALREGQLDGVDTDVIMVAGDSAGGNLSATLCGYLKDKGERQPEAQVLLYPITDISNMDRTCHRRYADDYFFTLETLQWTSTSYVSEDSKRRDPWVSPLYSVNLQGLAPAHVVLAECDVLVGEGMAYAEKLHESGVNVECHLYRGVVHAFMAMAGSVDLGKVAFDGSVEFMKRYF
jgi:acetyl esterase